MFKKIISLMTTIALSTMTSFPAYAHTEVAVDNTPVNKNLIYTQKNTELVSHIENLLENSTIEKSVETVIHEEVVVETKIIEEEIIEETEFIDEETSITEFITYIMESTAYTGGGITASGLEVVRNSNGLSTIAVDPNVIPLGSLLEIPGYGYAIAADTGGAINGNIIDIYFDTYHECIDWGRRTITVNLIAYPGEW